MKADQIINFFQRAMGPIKDTIRLMTGKGIIKIVDDSAGIQTCQISALAGETLSKVPRMQHFGFTSNPPAGTEAIIISLGGLRENVVIIGDDNRSIRIKNLAPGESAIYTDDGTIIELKKGGLVNVVAATKVMISVPDVEMSGNLKVTGNLEIIGTSHLTGAVQADATINVIGIVGAGGFSGPLGGAPAPMVTAVPIQSSAPITSSDVITGSNVVGGGTDLANVKTKFNTHTHPENGSGGGTTSPTTGPL